MKRFLRSAALAAAALLAVSMAAPASVLAQDSPSVDATLVSFDNKNVSALSSGSGYLNGDIDGDGKINAKDVLLCRLHIAAMIDFTPEQAARGDVDCDGVSGSRDIVLIRRKIVNISDYEKSIVKAERARISWDSGSKSARVTATGDGGFGVRVDASGFGFDSASHEYAVIDLTVPDGTDVSAVRATPLYGGNQCGSAALTGEAAAPADNGGGTVLSLAVPTGRSFSGILLSFDGSSLTGKSVYISGVYLCADKFSADWICENAVSAPEGTPKTLTAQLDDEDIAIRLLDMNADDKANTNGGTYHDFKNSKWPSVAVDENDKLYVVASGLRMAHIDPFGATIMATSTDKGESWTKPSVVSNTVLDDRDAGITYLGNGKMLVSYFTQSAANYLPGGEGYDSLKPYSAGGSAPSWAAEWDSNNHPVGGILGTHLDILKYVSDYTPGYNTGASSFVVSSENYGASWNTQKLSLSGRAVSAEMTSMNTNFGFSYPGTEVPVTSAHGPTALSDGTVLFAGKVMKADDLPLDSMAVYKSEDDGVTWSFLSEIPRPDGYVANNFHELSVTETADGTLVCAIRTQTSGNVNISPLYTVYTCFSYDKGLSWTTPAATGLQGTPPHVVTMANGDIVMTTGYRTDPRCIYATVSTDNGRTWSNQVRVSRNFITGDDMGYPSSAVLSDGTICTVYYGTYSSADGYSSILCSQWKYSFN